MTNSHSTPPPPFWQTQTLSNIALATMKSLIDMASLFHDHWQFPVHLDTDLTSASAHQAQNIFDRLWAQSISDNLFLLHAKLGYFKCHSHQTKIIVQMPGTSIRLEFPRSRTMPHHCLSDFFTNGIWATCAWCVHMNQSMNIYASNDKHGDGFYLRGLGKAINSAFRQYTTALLIKKWALSNDSALVFSPGDAECPDIMQRKQWLSILNTRDINMSLSSKYTFDPILSNIACISIDPNATHFIPV